MGLTAAQLEALPADLPTLDRLGVSTIPADLDAAKIAAEWLAAFGAAVESKDIEAIAGLFIAESWWRDMLAFTWSFRTFNGINAIKQFLSDRLGSTKASGFKLRQDLLGLQKPYPDIAWINILFDFETDVGLGFGIVRLVPTPNGEWKAYVVYTNLEDLKG